MPPPEAITTQRAGMGWMLWSVALALPWLVPTHNDPWTTFYGEALTAAVLLPLAAWALWRTRGPWRVGALAGTFAVAALIPLVQALGGQFVYPAEAPLVSLYLTAIALTVLIARHAEAVAPMRVADALFAGLALAALLSTGIALSQWLGLDGLGVLMAPAAMGGRPMANIGQPNHLATLLVWGLVAVWWAHTRRSIGGVGATLAAAFLLAGVVLTQSRAGLLGVALLGIAAVWCRDTLKTRQQAPAWVALALWFVIALVALDPLSREWLGTTPRSVTDAAAPRERLAIYAFALSAIAQQPWSGYGWNQIVTAHGDLAAQFPLHGIVMNAHNVVLDLMLWAGIPIAILLMAGAVRWGRAALRGHTKPEPVLLAVALAVLLLHALLEAPHVFAYFLLPAALMLGTLDAYRRDVPAHIGVPRLVVACLVLLHAVVLWLMFVDYGRIEASEQAAAMRAANIANARPAEEPDLTVLTALQAGLATARTVPRREMPANALSAMRDAVRRYPNVGGLFRYAQASALNGRPDEARRALTVLCALHSRRMCEAAAADWAQLASTELPEMKQAAGQPGWPLPKPR
jgi:O-antigen ligase